MLFHCQWHLIEKYDLMTGERRNPQVITASRIGDRQRCYTFDHDSSAGVQVRAYNSPLRPGDHQRLLVARPDRVRTCLPSSFDFCASPRFAFVLLRTEEEYMMAKMAFTFAESDDGTPDDWLGFVKVS